jgi:hypothetical protein
MNLTFFTIHINIPIHIIFLQKNEDIIYKIVIHTTQTMSELTTIEKIEEEIGLACNPTQTCSILSTLCNGWDSIDGEYKHPLLRFFTLKEARTLRLICSEFLNAVEITPWDDLSSCIGRKDIPISESIALYMECFPRAISANVSNRNDLLDHHFAILCSMQSLNVSYCTHFTNIAFSYLSKLRTLIMVHCTRITNKGFKYLYNLESLRAEGCDKLTITSTMFRNLQFLQIDRKKNLFIKNYNLTIITGSPVEEIDSIWLSAKDEKGYTPLYLMANNQDYNFAKYLLDRHVNVDCTDDMGNTALHVACLRSPSMLIRLLLERGATIHAKNKNGNTPLHFALFRGSVHYDIESIKLLLEAGASANTPNYKGITPLAHMCRYGTHTYDFRWDIYNIIIAYTDVSTNSHSSSGLHVLTPEI